MNISQKELQIKNSIIYLIPMIVKNLLLFITIPIFTRILLPKDYGHLAISMIFATLFSGLANFGLTSIYDRSYFEYKKNLKESSQLLFSILLYLIISFVIFLIFTYYFKLSISNFLFNSFEFGDLIFWTLFGQLFISINYYYLAFYKNSENAKQYSLYTIIISILNFLLSIYFIVFLHKGIIGIVYAQSLSGFIVCIYLTFIFVKNMGFFINTNFLFDSLKISFPLTPKIFLGIINTQFDKYVISLMESAGGVGIYSIGQRISNVCWVFMGSLQNVFSPQIYKRLFNQNNKNNPEDIGSYLYPFVYIAILPTFILAIFSSELISILTPSSYHGAINIVSILCLYYGIVLFRKFYGVQIIFSKKTLNILAESIVSIFLNIILNIILIKEFGIIGAAIATLLTGSITVPIFFLIAQKLYSINWEFKKILFIYLSFISFTLVIVTMRFYDINYINILLVKLIAITCYLLIGIKSNIISKKNYLVFKRAIFSSK